MEGVSILRLPSPPIRFIGTIVYGLCLAWYLTIWRYRYDVIQVFHADYDAVVAGVVGKLLGKISVVRLAGASSSGDLARLSKSPVAGIVIWAIRSADRVITLSSELRNEAIAYGCSASRIVVIPNGIDLKRHTVRAEKPLQKGRQVILWVGRFRKEKGLDILLKGWSLVRKGEGGSLPLELLLVGDGPEFERIVSLADALNIKSSVSFVGLVEDVSPYLRLASAFVLPSLAEGLSVALLEAMAAGLPVVATRVSGSSDVIAHEVNGLLIKPHDPDELADAIVKLANDRELALKLGAAARLTIEERYTIERIVTRYIALYRQLLAEARGL